MGSTSTKWPPRRPEKPAAGINPRHQRSALVNLHRAPASVIPLSDTHDEEQ